MLNHHIKLSQNHNEILIHTYKYNLNQKTVYEKCWWESGEIRTLLHCFWDIKCCSHFGKHLKLLNIELLCVCVCVCVCVSHSIMTDSLESHWLYPIRLLCLWDSPGKNTGVSSHSLLHTPSGSSVYGILQARILEWVAIPFSIWPSNSEEKWKCTSIQKNLMYFFHGSIIQDSQQVETISISMSLEMDF